MVDAIQAATITSNSIALGTLNTNQISSAFYAWLLQSVAGGVQNWGQLQGGTSSGQSFLVGSGSTFTPQGSGVIGATYVTGSLTNSVANSTWATNMPTGGRVGLLNVTILPGATGTRLMATNADLIFMETPNPYLQADVPFTNRFGFMGSFTGDATNLYLHGNSTVDNLTVQSNMSIGSITTPSLTSAALIATNVIYQSSTGTLTNNLKNMLIAWSAAKAYQAIAPVLDQHNTMTSSVVLWPDGTYGAFTSTNYNSTWFLVDGYTLTYTNAGETISQATVSRNSFGYVTNQPALTIAP